MMVKQSDEGGAGPKEGRKERLGTQSAPETGLTLPNGLRAFRIVVPLYKHWGPYNSPGIFLYSCSLTAALPNEA